MEIISWSHTPASHCPPATLGRDFSRDYDIHLPPRLVTRTVEGVVYFSDGQLVTDGYVSIKESEEINVMRGYASGRIDRQGRFSLRVLDGTKGWLQAYGLPDGIRLGMRMLYMKPVKIEVFSDSKNLKIIIPLKDGEKTTPVK